MAISYLLARIRFSRSRPIVCDATTATSSTSNNNNNNSISISERSMPAHDIEGGTQVVTGSSTSSTSYHPQQQQQQQGATSSSTNQNASDAARRRPLHLDEIEAHGVGGLNNINMNTSTNNSNNAGNSSESSGTPSAATTGRNVGAGGGSSKPHINPAPRSRSGVGLPLIDPGQGNKGNLTSQGVNATNSIASSQQYEPRLLHPILNVIPLHVRFGLNGLLCNVLFMIAYNSAISSFEYVAPSTIYAVVYLIFIPLGHAMASILVFGWPENYVPSLMSNFPIGLTAIAIGGVLTAYLDKIRFNENITNYVRDNYQFYHMPSRKDEEQHEGEFYSSILVLVVTSIWTYVLSVYVNSPPAKSDKKEL